MVSESVKRKKKLKWRTHTHLLDIVSALADTKAANSRTRPALTSTSSHVTRHLACLYGRSGASDANFTTTHGTRIICGNSEWCPRPRRRETQRELRMNETKTKNATLPSSCALCIFAVPPFCGRWRKKAVDVILQGRLCIKVVSASCSQPFFLTLFIKMSTLFSIFLTSRMWLKYQDHFLIKINKI